MKRSTLLGQASGLLLLTALVTSLPFEEPASLDGLSFDNFGDEGFRHDQISFAHGDFRWRYSGCCGLFEVERGTYQSGRWGVTLLGHNRNKKCPTSLTRSGTSPKMVLVDSRRSISLRQSKTPPDWESWSPSSWKGRLSLADHSLILDSAPVNATLRDLCLGMGEEPQWVEESEGRYRVLFPCGLSGRFDWLEPYEPEPDRESVGIDRCRWDDPGSRQERR